MAQEVRISYLPTADAFDSVSGCSAVVVMVEEGAFVTAACNVLFKCCVTGIPGEATKPSTTMGRLVKSCHEWWL